MSGRTNVGRTNVGRTYVGRTKLAAPSFKQSQQNVFNFSDKSIMCINVWYLGEILDVVCYFCLILEYKVHTSTSDVTKISLKITLLTD